LFDEDTSEASQITRDYALELDRRADRPPILSVYGGKLTTYRKLSERVLEKLAPLFSSMGPPWTAGRPLPGGALPEGGIDALTRTLAERFPGLQETLLMALVRRHGSLAAEVLAGASGDGADDRHFGGDLYAFEVDYLVRREWARTAEDVLWRRTKTGLRLEPAARDDLTRYLREVQATRTE
jgi:glycerol-3-phosphate dehydrogenase